jgi:hypothetical protein
MRLPLIIGIGACIGITTVATLMFCFHLPESAQEAYLRGVTEFDRKCPEKRHWPEGVIPTGQLTDVVDFEIPAGTVEEAMACLERQSGVFVRMDDESDNPDVKEREQKRTAGPVTGKQRALDAARKILLGTDFFIENPDDTVSGMLVVRLKEGKVARFDRLK